MTEPNCIVCGSETHPLRAAGSTFSQCAACGYALVQGAREKEYWGDGEGVESEYWSTRKSDYFSKALDHLATSTGSKGRLLDIGGGVGFFSETALSRGWDAV